MHFEFTQQGCCFTWADLLPACAAQVFQNGAEMSTYKGAPLSLERIV